MRAAALILLGLFLGFVGALVQAYEQPVGPVVVPLGLLLVLASLVPVARASAWWIGSRLGAVLFSTGWVAATLVMGSPMPGGDLVLASGWREMTYLIGGTILLGASCGFPLLPEDDRTEDDRTGVGRTL